MTKVVALRTPEPDLVAIVADLAERLEAEQAERLKVEAELVERVAELKAEQAEIKARLPARPIVLPPNWVSIKDAAVAAHYSAKSLYRFHREGVIDSQKLGDGKITRIAINIDTLAACLAARKRKKRKMRN